MKRVAIPVEEELYDDLKFIPKGIRAEAFRCLLRLLINTQRTTNVYIIDDLINERLSIVKSEPDGTPYE